MKLRIVPQPSSGGENRCCIFADGDELFRVMIRESMRIRGFLFD